MSLVEDYASHFSQRENAVFVKFVMEGKSNKEIAAELGIAYATVKVYWNRILAKLGCNSQVGAVVDLVRYALRRGTRRDRNNAARGAA